MIVWCGDLRNWLRCQRNVGDVDEYVGCKIVRDYDENSFKFTHPVMLQSFKDEYDTKATRTPATPAEPGSVLVKAIPEDKVGKVQHTYYRSGVGKLLHMMRWSRPDIQNSVRDCSRQGSAPVQAHIKALHRVMEYCMGTPERGWYLRPSRVWDGIDKDFEFIIRRISDSDNAK